MSAPQHIKITHVSYRLPKHSHSSYMHWLNTVQLPRILPILKRHGMISVDIVGPGATLPFLANTFQFTTPPDLNEVAKEKLGGIHPTWEFASYDCVVEYIMPDLATVAKMTADPEWAVATKFEGEWIDDEKGLVSVGYVSTHLLPSGEILKYE